MNVEVYHRDEPTFRESESCAFPVGFTLVASMEIDPPHGGASDQVATALDVAFERTNHIDAPWHESLWLQGRQIEVHTTRPRSTSVGDVVVVDGLASLCMSAGWAALLPQTASDPDEWLRFIGPCCEVL